jgi:hypothetical protein
MERCQLEARRFAAELAPGMSAARAARIVAGRTTVTGSSWGSGAIRLIRSRSCRAKCGVEPAWWCARGRARRVCVFGPLIRDAGALQHPPPRCCAARVQSLVAGVAIWALLDWATLSKQVHLVPSLILAGGVARPGRVHCRRSRSRSSRRAATSSCRSSCSSPLRASGAKRGVCCSASRPVSARAFESIGYG